MEQKPEDTSDEDDFGDFNEPDSSQEEEEEDGFGDFEEVKPTKIVSHCFEYNGDYKANAEEIDKLVTQMLGSTPLSESPVQGVGLNERCGDLYFRLVGRSVNMQQINWKQSFIRRQLLLNLGIPINLDEVTPSNRNNLSRRTSQEWDYVISEVPPYEDLKINGEERKAVIANTDEQLEGLYKRLQPLSYYKNLAKGHINELEEQLAKLRQVKQELLRTVSCWNSKLEDDKKDNEIFTSYVENLVGHTQKLRREAKR